MCAGCFGFPCWRDGDRICRPFVHVVLMMINTVPRHMELWKRGCVYSFSGWISNLVLVFNLWNKLFQIHGFCGDMLWASVVSGSSVQTSQIQIAGRLFGGRKSRMARHQQNSHWAKMMRTWRFDFWEGHMKLVVQHCPSSVVAMTNQSRASNN